MGALPQAGETQLPEPFDSCEASELDLWELFDKRFQALGGSFVSWKELEKYEDQSWYVDPLVELPQTFNPHRSHVWKADFGVTRADLAIAEAGTFLLAQGVAARLASLAPPMHVVVIHKSSIVHSLAEAVPHFGRRNAVLVTGPSRTADIEGVLVRGVHGPKSILALVEGT